MTIQRRLYLINNDLNIIIILSSLHQSYNLFSDVVKGEISEREEETMNVLGVAQVVPPVDQESIVLAGYKDCTDEAIRYLLEVEKMPEDDPLVLGLRQHLLARQQQLDVERILNSSHNGATTGSRVTTSISGDSDSVVTSAGNSQPVLCQSQVLLGHQGQLPALLSPSSTGHAMVHVDTHSSRSTTPMSDMASSEARSELSDSSEYHVAPDSVICSTPSPHHPGSQPQQLLSPQQPEPQEQQQEVSSVLNLALLAQSNPAIASLTEEILSLLEGEVPVDINAESEEEADSAFMDESIE